LRLKKFLLLVFVCTALGCGAIFNPYSSKFNCPETDKGKCVSVNTAYEESVSDAADEKSRAEQKEKKGKSEEEKAIEEQSPEKLYEEALFKELTGLIDDPRTPMVAPPRVVRVLLLPYRGENNELFMLRYVYFFVDEHRWILGDYLNR
jgi:conjugal transfer pilus assembly protein TraV